MIIKIRLFQLALFFKIAKLCNKELKLYEKINEVICIDA